MNVPRDGYGRGIEPSVHPRWFRRLGAILAAAMLAGACSSGGGESATEGPSDPLDEVAQPGERTVQFAGAGRVRLSGTMTVPPAAAGTGLRSPNAVISVPGVLFVPTATGRGDRNGLLGPTGTPDGLAGELAQAMSAAGTASYRYDGRGTGESRLEPDVRLSFDDLVADARAALDLLAQRRETAGKELTVVGYDAGGFVALRLATTDDRVKRLILISTPGRSLLDTQAAELTAQFGPEPAEELRAAVASLRATRSLPATPPQRAEARALLPPGEVGFLADLYAFDPAAEAAKVRVPAMLVLPRVSAPYDPGGFSAIPRLTVVNSAVGGPTLLSTGDVPSDDPSDPASPTHEHGAGPNIAPTERDAETVGRIVAFASGAPPG